MVLYMTIKECYAMMESDYEDVIARLSKDERVEKYLRKFLVSTDYSDLVQAVADKNYEDVFRFSHNLKGMGLNLSFTKLYTSASELCENVRGGAPKADCEPLMAKVMADYNQVINAIKMLDQ